MQTHSKQIQELLYLLPGWDTYGAETPNACAVHAAEEVLRAMHACDLIPDRIAASADGGVALMFYRDRKYADVECFNDGEVLAGTTDGHAPPCVWDVRQTGIPGSLEQIRKHLDK